MLLQSSKERRLIKDQSTETPYFSIHLLLNQCQELPTAACFLNEILKATIKFKFFAWLYLPSSGQTCLFSLSLQRLTSFHAILNLNLKNSLRAQMSRILEMQMKQRRKEY